MKEVVGRGDRKHGDDYDADEVDAGDGVVNVRLALAINSSSHRPFPPPPPSSPPRPWPPSSTPDLLPLVIAPPPNPTRGSRPAAPARARRRNSAQGPKDRSKGEVVPPAFPWCADRRATVHPLAYLLSHGITEVHGEARCSQCQARREIRYDLASKFDEVAAFVRESKHLMHDRAPLRWTKPTSLPACEACRAQNCMLPVVAEKKRQINWLFMLLGQTLGCCSLKQLKYFCKHNKQHRTGAKDRLLYLTYLGLCKRLVPTQPFFY